MLRQREKRRESRFGALQALYEAALHSSVFFFVFSTFLTCARSNLGKVADGRVFRNGWRTSAISFHKRTPVYFRADNSSFIKKGPVVDQMHAAFKMLRRVLTWQETRAAQAVRRGPLLDVWNYQTPRPRALLGRESCLVNTAKPRATK